MRLYLTKRSIPELAVLSPQERDAIWSAALRKILGNWRWWLALAAFGVAAYLMLGLLGALKGSGASGAARLLLAAAFGGVGGLAAAQIGIRLMRPHMRDMLEARRRRAVDRDDGRAGS